MTFHIKLKRKFKIALMNFQLKLRMLNNLLIKFNNKMANKNPNKFTN
jgi:hypothetical protein